MNFEDYILLAEKKRNTAEVRRRHQFKASWHALVHDQLADIERTDASNYVWEVVTAVHEELERKAIPPDTKILRASALGKYALMTSRHRAPSKVAQAVRNTREDIFRARNTIDGWSLGVEVSGADEESAGGPDLQTLYLGTDGNLYGMGRRSEREERKEVVVPNIVFESGVVFNRMDSQVNDCAEVLTALARIADRHELEPPGGWPAQS